MTLGLKFYHGSWWEIFKLGLYLENGALSSKQQSEKGENLGLG